MQYDLEGTNLVTAVQFMESNPENDTLQWKPEQQQDKGKKQAIVVHKIQKGSIGGVGSKYGGTILLQNLQSNFTTHTYTFEQSKQDLLKQPLSELLANKANMDYKELKDLVQLQCSFDLYSDDTNYQPEEARTEVKALEMMHKRICENVAKQLTDLPKNPNFINAGFLSKKYDNYLQTDVVKTNMIFNIANTSDQYDNAVEIVIYDKKSDSYIDLSQECKTVQDFIMLLRKKRMDIVVYYESCAVKRQGRDVYLYPKLRIHQIVLHEYVRKQHSTIGLNLNNTQ